MEMNFQRREIFSQWPPLTNGIAACLALLLQPPEGESPLLHLFADSLRVLSRGDDQDLPGFQRAGDGGGRRGGRGGAGGAGHGASRRRGQRQPAKRPGHHLLPTTEIHRERL